MLILINEEKLKMITKWYNQVPEPDVYDTDFFNSTFGNLKDESDELIEIIRLIYNANPKFTRLYRSLMDTFMEIMGVEV